MCYRAQINLAMKHQCYANNKSSINLFTSKKFNMGTIYWQLNDVWSAPTWSTIDAASQWKMAHYAAIREYFHLPSWGRIATQLENNKTFLAHWIPNFETNRPLIPDYFNLICLTIHSFKPIHKTLLEFDQHELNNSCPYKILDISLNDLISTCKFDSKLNLADMLVQIEIVVNGSGRNLFDGSLLMLDKPKNIKLWPDKQIRIKYIKLIPYDKIIQSAPMQSNIVYELVLETNYPQLFVWLHLNPYLNHQYWFDMNGFHIFTRNSSKIRLYLANIKEPIPIEKLKTFIWIDALSTLTN